MRYLQLILSFLLIASPSHATVQGIIHAGGAISSTTVVTYTGVLGQTAWGSVAGDKLQLIAANGVLRNLIVVQLSAPGAGKSRDYNIQINGVDSTLSCTIADTNTSCVDTDALRVTAGQTMRIEYTPTSTPAANNAQVSLEFVPDTDGQTLLSGGTLATNLVNSATRYVALHGITTPQSVESPVETVIPTAGQVCGLQAQVGAVPGAGASWTFTVRTGTAAGAMADSSVACTISGAAATTCSDSDCVSVAVGDRISVSSVPSVGTIPTAARGYFGAIFLPTDTDEYILSYNSLNTNLSATANRFLPIQSASIAPATSVLTTYGQTPSNVVLKNMYVRLSAAPGVGKSYTTYFYNNAAQSVPYLTVSGTDTYGVNYNFSALSYNRQTYSLVVPSGTPTVATINLSYTATAGAAHLNGSTLQGATLQ